MPEFTWEEYATEQELEDAILMRLCKIGVHELGHAFCLGHCIHYQCLMMGTNHLT